MVRVGGKRKLQVQATTEDLPRIIGVPLPTTEVPPRTLPTTSWILPKEEARPPIKSSPATTYLEFLP